MNASLPWQEYDPASMAEAARNFECGPEFYDQEVKRWLLENAHFELAREGDDRGEVWVHLDPLRPERMIAFGALSRATWPCTEEMTTFPKLAMIDALAVHRAYRRGGAERTTDGPKYGSLLMEHLLQRADAMRLDQRVVGLFVRPENEPAIRLYQAYGFAYIGPDAFDDAGAIRFYARPLSRGPAR